MTQQPHAKLLYQVEQLPIFQNRMYGTREEARSCPKGDIYLVEDQRSGLVYNAAFRSELMTYDANYQNEQAVSGVFQNHLETVSQIIERTIGRASIVEVGCGKGFFLEMLLNKGFEITGFDPTYEGNNPKIVKEYFRTDLGIHAEALVLRHVLEHIQDPYEFLLQLKEANSGRGKIYIEVPCLDWICEHKAWFDIFYEHVNYFRIADFYRMFDVVIESGRVFGNQYLYVVADLSSLKAPVINNTDTIVFPTEFKPEFIQCRHAAVWGGASKGVIFSLLKEREGYPIDAVIDINPAKQGKYLPATGLLVESPSNALSRLPVGSTIYVMNSNYLEEIKVMSNNAYKYIGVDNE
jgi:SAM-dependent methyltransferase